MIHKKLIYLSSTFSIFVVLFSFAVTNMASLYIVGDLGGSTDTTSYTITFYGLGNALSIPLVKYLRSRFSLKHLLLSFHLAFALTILVTAYVPNYPAFIGMRLLQGFASGPIFLFATSLYGHPDLIHERDRFLWTVLLIFVTASALGASWGAYLAYDFHWTYIFKTIWIVIVLISILVSIALKPIEMSFPSVKFDLGGYISYSMAILSLGMFITLGQELDWFRSPFLVSLFLLGSISLIYFLVRSCFHEDPLIDFTPFKKFSFTFAIINLAFLFSLYFGMILLLALWLSLYVNYTIDWVGVILLVMVMAAIIVMIFVRRYLSHRDKRIALGLALIFLALSCFYTTIFNVEIDLKRVAISRIMAGFGFALFLPPIFHLCVKGFSEEETISAITIFQLARTLSSGLGSAIYLTMWWRRRVFFHERLGETLTQYSEETKAFFTRAKLFHLQGLRADATLEDFLNREATALALDDCFYFMGWLMVALFLFLLMTVLLDLKKEHRLKMF